MSSNQKFCLLHQPHRPNLATWLFSIHTVHGKLILLLAYCLWATVAAQLRLEAHPECRGALPGLGPWTVWKGDAAFLLSTSWLWTQCDQQTRASAVVTSLPWLTSPQTVNQNWLFLPYVPLARCFAIATRKETDTFIFPLTLPAPSHPFLTSQFPIKPNVVRFNLFFSGGTQIQVLEQSGKIFCMSHTHRL